MSLPGLTWRIKADRDGWPALNLEFKPSQRVEFDELVLGNPCAIHIEQLGDRHWMIDIAGWHGNLHIPANGPPRLEWHETPDGR